MRAKQITARFALGHKVRRIAFKDCFGVDNPASSVLTVEQVIIVCSDYIAPYYRVLAGNETERHEGAERFFEFAWVFEMFKGESHD